MSTLRSGVEELSSEDLGTVPDAPLEDDLGELLSVGDALEAEILRRISAIERRRSFERDGFLSTVSWLVARFRLSRSRAADLVRLAHAMRQMPRVSEAFVAGEVPGSALRALADAHAVHPEAFADSEELLVEAARSLPVRQLQQAVAHWKQLADERQGRLGQDDELHERRRLYASRTLFGMVRLDGDLDPETGECVLAALDAAVDAGARSAGESDGRTPAQRRADALGEICRGWLDRSDRPEVAGERPHVSVVVDLDVLTGRSGGCCELERTGPVAVDVARRIACDASVSRIVLGPRSEPLDLGRRTPVVPASLRRAVVVRDSGCRFPRCDRPHGWCDAHHVVNWANGGPTSLSNLLLLCRRHHRLVHQGGFGLRMEGGIPMFSRPDGSHLKERAPP